MNFFLTDGERPSAKTAHGLTAKDSIPLWRDEMFVFAGPSPAKTKLLFSAFFAPPRWIILF
jgi:hypothetical protein